ncbi:MAG: thermostable hemolysin [Planctomycetota bacterium]|nr:thermostable hemolysin [Planctomycetota bacterium]
MKMTTLKVVRSDDAGYDPVVAYAKKRYEDIHEAHLERVSPILLTAFQNDTIVGCIGISPAKIGPMLAESYLNQPLQSTLKQLGLEDVKRDALVEVGSLAADNGRIALRLLSSAPHSLQDGYSHALLTATRLVRRLIQCAGITTFELATARRQALPQSEQLKWGRYYNDDPRVLLVDLTRLGKSEVRRAS